MIRAVIFDMDGLLLETEIVSYQIYKELLEEFGYEFTTHEYSEQYSGKTEIINVNNLIDTYELPWSTELGIEKVSLKEKDLLSRGVDLKPGVGKVLSYLKNNNYKIALATSSTQDRAFGVLEEHNILDYFDTEVYSEDVDRSKPNPDIFLQAAKKSK